MSQRECYIRFIKTEPDQGRGFYKSDIARVAVI